MLFTNIECPFFHWYLATLLQSKEEGKKSPRKNVAEARVDLRDACIRRGHATDRATAPGMKKVSHEKETQVAC